MDTIPSRCESSLDAGRNTEGCNTCTPDLKSTHTRSESPHTKKDYEAVLGVWLPAPLPTPRALPDRGALWPLAVGVEKDLGGIDV